MFAPIVFRFQRRIGIFWHAESDTALTLARLWPSPPLALRWIKVRHSRVRSRRQLFNDTIQNVLGINVAYIILPGKELPYTRKQGARIIVHVALVPCLGRNVA